MIIRSAYDAHMKASRGTQYVVNVRGAGMCHPSRWRSLFGAPHGALVVFKVHGWTL